MVSSAGGLRPWGSCQMNSCPLISIVGQALVRASGGTRRA
ncbi:Uncharacterised protein [Mycobacteroides abscessus subsp. abscessus]|nr:Uncharacterised protein [Mycobacteroides abscessus subsp. abscessus]